MPLPVSRHKVHKFSASPGKKKGQGNRISKKKKGILEPPSMRLEISRSGRTLTGQIVLESQGFSRDQFWGFANIVLKGILEPENLPCLKHDY